MGKLTRVIEWLLNCWTSGGIWFRFLTCQPLTATTCLIMKYSTLYNSSSLPIYNKVYIHTYIFVSPATSVAHWRVKERTVVEWLLKGRASGEISFRFLACQPLSATACVIATYSTLNDLSSLPISNKVHHLASIHFWFPSNQCGSLTGKGTHGGWVIAQGSSLGRDLI